MMKEIPELTTLRAQLEATAQLAEDMMRVKQALAVIHQALFHVEHGIVHRMDRLEQGGAPTATAEPPRVTPTDTPRERVDFARLRRIANGEEVEGE